MLALNLPLDQAKAMTQALLEVGASSAQADMKQTTALHYISGEKPEVLETLIQYDEPAAKRAINHLAVTGSSWSPSAQSPLMSAILQGNALAALKLLEAGAKPSVDFQSWIKSMESAHENIANRDSKQNHNNYLRDIEQPIVLAVQAELPDLVRSLLERGVDVNTLPKQTQQGVVDEYYMRHNTMQTLLDVVRARIDQLRSWKDSKPPTESEYKLREGVNYLEGIEPGSYKDFIARIDLDAARASDKHTKESWESQMKTYNERKGVAEKQEAVNALAAEFEQLEKDLLERGAKTFKELLPEKVIEPEDNSYHHNHRSYDYEKPPFGIEFTFQVHDLTDETREAYLKL